VAHDSRRPSPLFKRISSCITLFEACSTFTQVPACVLAKSPKATLYIEVLSMVNSIFHCSDCYRLERLAAGWDSHPLKTADFHGALNNPG
jgi:hypothetical protein